ncbi:extracellular solute-binding protein [Chthonobacter albigriseus]|uniref:extracellular solute-binding protein n=1 Tax=Chthonobacter albigriseus TaxID=1683161 RepID=UPI0015EED694|nr:extracellular solute-binding protein [Chthonobacter albigriseus]
MTDIQLRGMTWSHPRGFDPLVAASDAWRARTGVSIAWDKRSLQDFESFPVRTLAETYDLIVIDHPHVGQITAEDCLLPLDVPGREEERARLSAGSVGASYPSYRWKGRQWAFPIDAATQVQAYRPDRLPGPLQSFDEVVTLARAGAVILPLRPPHSLMCFFTLAAHLGHACSTEGPELIDPQAGAAVYEHLHSLASVVDPAGFEMDPIAAFEAMAEPTSRFRSAPLIYGYVNYAIDGFRPSRIAFGDMPVIDGRPPHGSALGGTGIAVSAFSANPEAAVDFAYWVAGGEVQRGLYATAGGQPGHSDAWTDAATNDATHGFYRATRRTLDGAWLRPRHDGYMPFQHEAAELINQTLRRGSNAEAFIRSLNHLYRQSFR